MPYYLNFHRPEDQHVAYRCDERCYRSPLPPDKCKCICHGHLHGVGIDNAPRLMLKYLMAYTGPFRVTIAKEP